MLNEARPNEPNLLKKKTFAHESHTAHTNNSRVRPTASIGETPLPFSPQISLTLPALIAKLPSPHFSSRQKHLDPQLSFTNRLVCIRKRLSCCSCKIPILDPRSRPCRVWDFIILLVVLYSVILVPVEIGFPQFQISKLLLFASAAADFFYLIDVIHHFFLGFYPHDEETMITDIKAISYRYVTRWFFPDLLATIPTEFLSLSLKHSEKTVLSFKLTRLSRIIRMAKLARVIRLPRFASMLQTMFELDVVYIRLAGVICKVLLITHVVTCFWHLIGYSEDPSAMTWISATQMTDDLFSTRYIYAYYWVVTTLAGVGFGDVHAVNTQERLFSILVQVIGAGGFGLMIGNISRIIENWNRESNYRIRRLSMTQEFLRNKKLPKPLQQSLNRYFQHFVAKTSAFSERDLLSEFSLSLREEILRETYKSTFFRITAFQNMDPQLIMDMVMYIKPVIAVQGDVLARENSFGTEMFILNHGLIEVQRTASKGSWIVVLEMLTSQSIFGEACLLNCTLHQNSYTAKDYSDLYCLPRSDFVRLLDDHPEAEQALLAYHDSRNALYEIVYEQTLARYKVYMKSTQKNLSVAIPGIENVYPSLKILFNGVLTPYRSIPTDILQKLTLEISMGVSVFNSAREKAKMISIIANEKKLHTWSAVRQHCLTPVHPHHPYKLTWDSFIVLVLLYCGISIPFELTFLASDSISTSAQYMETYIDVVLTLDIVLCLRTSYIDHDGELVTNNRAIFWQYVKTWFSIDLLSTLPLNSIVSALVTSVKNSHTFSLIRAIRLFKLFRLLKLMQSTEKIQIVTMSHHSVMRIAMLVLKVVYIAHFLSCGYYYVVCAAANMYPKSLLSSIPITYTAMDKYIYFTYWAITTMTTVGYGDSTPTNALEVVFVIVSVIVGASTLMYTIGTLGNFVDEIRMTEDISQERLDHVKAYLKERKVSKPLVARVVRYYEFYLSHYHLRDGEEIFSALSDNLRAQLILHLNRDVVSKFDFFASQDDACVSYLISILYQEYCTPREYVFKQGQVGRHMYFLYKGIAEVVFYAGKSEEIVVSTITEGNYFGEIAMLTTSKRAASIRARTYISLLVLSREGLDRLASQYPEMANSIIKEFRKKIIQIKEANQSKSIAPNVQADLKPISTKATDAMLGENGLHAMKNCLHELEGTVVKIVQIYGGGDKGKRKALQCVLQHLRTFEFSLDDFLLAAEDAACFMDTTGPLPDLSGSKAIYNVHKVNQLQRNINRRKSSLRSD